MNEIPLDSGWRFRLGDTGNGTAPSLDDSGWRLLDVPHDWSIELPRSRECPSGDQGGFFADGIGWYRKHFRAPEAWRGRCVSIEFDGVYRDAQVWLNGRVLGRHPYGYTPFAFELGPYLRFGDEDNVLAVRVDNSTHRHTRWYSGSGIYRHVRLVVREPVHIPRYGIAVATPEVSGQEAVVSAEARVVNRTQAGVSLGLTWRIVAADGATAGAGRTTAACGAGSEAIVHGTLHLTSPRLWSPDRPHLYRLETSLDVDGAVVDRAETVFGVRSFRFTPTEGLVLNGTPTPLHGGCVHHDCGPLGAASIDRAEERKVELLKASGFNAVRCAHNPPAPGFLDACDRLGMLVIDEAFDVWRAPKLPYDYHREFDGWWQRDLDAMLIRDRNHPSVILWSIGNEVFERGLPEGAEIARMLADRVREVDPTRPVTAGICDLWDGTPWSATDALFGHLDVCGYNYRLDVYEDDHRRCPERVIVATESFPPNAYAYWKAVEALPYVAGDFVWTSMDYLGEAGIGRAVAEGESDGGLPGWPWDRANCGDIDLCGDKRPQSHYRDVFRGFRTRPYIAVHPLYPEGTTPRVSRWGWFDVQASWTWPGEEGRERRVDIYAPGDEVELLLNGTSLGRQPSGPASDFLAMFRVTYEPGELKAVVYRGGEPVAEWSLRTAGPAKSLRLTADRSCIAATPDDLAYVTVEVVDTRGAVCPCSADTVYFTVDGPGRIAAVASGDPRDTEPYRGNVHSVWRGRGLAILQPTGGAGVLTLRAQADGLGGAELTVNLEEGGSGA